MKHVKRENRVETINDIDLPEYQKRGWIEIDPTTGMPVSKDTKDDPAWLKAENVRLKRDLDVLELKLQNAQEKLIALTKPSDAESPETVVTTIGDPAPIGSGCTTGTPETSPNVITTSDEAQGNTSAPKHNRSKA